MSCVRILTIKIIDDSNRIEVSRCYSIQGKRFKTGSVMYNEFLTILSNSIKPGQIEKCNLGLNTFAGNLLLVDL